MLPKLTKNVLFVITTIILVLGMINIVTATDYTFDNLRQGESDTVTISYTASENIDIVFSVENITINEIPQYNYRDNEASFVFDPTGFIDLIPGEIVNSNLTATISDSAETGTYTAEIWITKSSGNASIQEQIHTLLFTVVANNEPTIIGTIPDANVIVGETYNETVTVLDMDDNDELTFSLDNAPTGMIITKTSNTTADITWTPTAYLETRTVAVKVNDGFGGEAIQDISANAVNSGFNLEIDTLTLGSNSQNRETTITKTFNIKNTGEDAITNLVISSLISDSDYNFNITSQPTSTIASGATTTFSVITYIPKDQDSGEKDIGSLQFTYNANGNSNIVETRSVTLTTENLLEISNVKYKINTKSKKSVDEGEEINVDIDDEIVFYIELENTGDDYNFEDGIEVTLEIDELDIDDDLDYDDDLDSGDDDTIEFEFTIPSDEGDGVMDVVLTATADDENNAEHTYTFEFEFDVDKPNHLIKIQDVTVSSNQIKQGRTGTINVDFENLGEDDEDRVYVGIKCSELDIDEGIGPLDMDDGDEFSRSITFEIPDDADVREYAIYVTTYYDTNHVSDEDFVTIDVIQSTTIAPTPQPSEPTGNDIQIIDNPTQPITQPSYGEPIKSNSVFGSDSTLLILLIIVIIVAIAVVIIILVPSKKK